jgi:hypothetical protein
MPAHPPSRQQQPHEQQGAVGSGGRGPNHKAGVAVPRGAVLPTQFTALDDQGEPVCVLDVEPPSFRTWRSADDLLVRCHVVCTLQISLGATNLVAFWATYWWTIAFSALCIVVGTAGSLRFRSLYSLRGTTCCFRSRSVVPAVLYGQLCISVMGALAVISAIISAVNADKGSIEYGFAIMSAVVSALLVIASGFGVFFIRRLAKRIKPTATVVVVAAPYGGEGEGEGEDAGGSADTNGGINQPRGSSGGGGGNGRRFVARSGAADAVDDDSAVDMSAVTALDPPARRGEGGARYAVPAEHHRQQQPQQRRALEPVAHNHVRNNGNTNGNGKRGGGQYAPAVPANPIERAAFPPQEYQQQQPPQYHHAYGGDDAAAPRYDQQRPVAPRARPAPEPQQQYRI